MVERKEHPTKTNARMIESEEIPFGQEFPSQTTTFGVKLVAR